MSKLLIKRLIAIGATEESAKSLVSSYSADTIRRWVKRVEYMPNIKHKFLYVAKCVRASNGW